VGYWQRRVQTIFGTYIQDRESKIFYFAEVKVYTPHLDDGIVWSNEETITCEHEHSTPNAAERCGRNIGRARAAEIDALR
jgi:hypothetical protein